MVNVIIPSCDKYLDNTFSIISNLNTYFHKQINIFFTVNSSFGRTVPDNCTPIFSKDSSLPGCVETLLNLFQGDDWVFWYLPDKFIYKTTDEDIEKMRELFRYMDGNLVPDHISILGMESKLLTEQDRNYDFFMYGNSKNSIKLNSLNLNEETTYRYIWRPSLIRVRVLQRLFRVKTSLNPTTYREKYLQKLGVFHMQRYTEKGKTLDNEKRYLLDTTSLVWGEVSNNGRNTMLFQKAFSKKY